MAAAINIKLIILIAAVKMGNSYILAKVNIIKYLLNEGEDK